MHKKNDENHCQIHHSTEKVANVIGVVMLSDIFLAAKNGEEKTSKKTLVIKA